ncbi:DNA primase [Acetitomaculum ruminis DSM 5522]|uniref:DNA primase n=1 Tax=Acetitomaculum ruminis DSM 5522 TaxID=1120918 RepID=A0A1I0VTN0_9FIRM|nr:DNA primase [Acetitomaculum ruminis]SFA79761.1 DNA primase [Acetitomaculum ruminis DSM 5522]
MAYYSDDFINEVCARNDIVDVISQHVKLTKKGSSYFGLCPFHNEKTGSFSVSPAKQMYYCFGCGAGGNIISFVKEYENYSFTEAMEYLAERVGMEVPKTDYDGNQKRRSNLRDKLFEINKEAAGYFYVALRKGNDSSGMEYLSKRNLSEDTLKKFGLGFAPKNSKELYNYLKSKSYSDEDLSKSGLFNHSETNGFYNKFWNRVIFPIMNVNNKVIGFGGRVMGQGEPKYLNSPETEIFDKSRNLYGLNIARTSRKNYFILCEGYMDVISLHQAGVDNALASLGTAFTSGQAELIKRYKKDVLISYDNDNAGIKATIRAISILRNAGLSPKVINLAPYKDPDEFIKGLGLEEFENRIQNARNGFLFEIDQLKKEYNLEDPAEKTLFYNEIAKKLVGFSEELERNNYIEAVAREFMIEYESLRNLVNRLGLSYVEKEKKYEDKSPINKANKSSGIEGSQKLLLTWIIESREIYDKVKEYILPEDFTNPVYEKAATLLYKQLDEGKCSPSIIINYFDDDQQKEVAALFNAKIDAIATRDDFEKALNETVYKIKENSVKQRKKENKNLQEFVNAKKILEKLKKNRISIKDIG